MLYTRIVDKQIFNLNRTRSDIILLPWPLCVRQQQLSTRIIISRNPAAAGWSEPFDTILDGVVVENRNATAVRFEPDVLYFTTARGIMNNVHVESDTAEV